MASPDIALMAHLMRRAGFGATRDEIEELVSRGYDTVVDEMFAPGDSQNMPDDLIRRYHVDMHELRFPNSASAYWLYRMVTTRRPLEEKIALFWHGIFATGYSKTNQSRSLLNQIDMFRRLGAGRLDTLLVELSRDPAMLLWLDNNENHNGAINENFGRELLELFSMGVGNYSEEDIKEASRAFTGWTLGNAEYMAARAAKDSIWPYGRIAWHFDFRQSDHDDGEKTFLGETGRLDGEDIIEIICRQEATARFIARHLYDFFVADEAPVPHWPYTPPVDPDAIDMLVAAYFDSDHDVGAMLRSMFKSDYFKAARFAHVKCPAELVVDTLRLTGEVVEPDLGMVDIANLVEYMGQMLLNPPSVEGWHEGVEWINTGALVDRVNFAATHMSNVDNPGVRDIINRIAGQNGEPLTPELLVDRCLDLMGPMTVSKKTRTALVDNLALDGDLSLEGHERGDASERVVGKLLGLIASTREYQLA
jgi:uncharacterized protein (DUF1800 family)